MTVGTLASRIFRPSEMLRRDSVAPPDNLGHYLWEAALRREVAINLSIKNRSSLRSSQASIIPESHHTRLDLHNRHLLHTTSTQ